MTIIFNVYILVGLLFLAVILFHSQFGLFKKLCITLIFALTVHWFENPDLLLEWFWKIRLMINY